MLGEDFLAYLTLALGGALVVGNALALIKPKRGDVGEALEAPLRRTLFQITVGGIASIWAIATILS